MLLLNVTNIIAAPEPASIDMRSLLQQANTQQQLGQHYKTIDTLKIAIGHLKSDSDKKVRATVLSALGLSYTQTGQYSLAEKTFDKCLEETGDQYPDIQSSIWNNKGLMFQLQSEPEKAINAFTQASIFSQKTDNKSLHAKTLANILRLKSISSGYEVSKEQFTVVYSLINQLENDQLKSELLINIAMSAKYLIEKDLKNTDYWRNITGELLSQAEVITINKSDFLTASYAIGYHGQLLYESGKLNQAINLTNRASFYAQTAESRESLYLWQWQQGKIHRDLNQYDKAIIAYRNTVETLQAIRNDISLALEAKKRSFRDTVGTIYFELTDLLLQRAAKTTNNSAKQKDLIEARHRIEQLKTVELVNYYGDDCVTELKERTLQLDGIGQQTAIYYPVLLDDRVELLLTLPNGIYQETVVIDKEEIINEVRSFRQLLEKRTTREYLRHSRNLYKWLIQPIEYKLAEYKIETLVIVPDTALRTIPMAALNNGKSYLIEKYAISYTPSLYVTDARPLPRENLQVLGNGLTQSVQGYPALPNVDKELQSLSKIFDSKIYIDEGYVLKNIQSSVKKEPYSIVHIASHGQFSANPDETFLLTYDDKINMDQLRNLMSISNYRDKPVELLTLSACQTAAGDDKAALGLAGVALKAGARSALATLWFVNDQATEKLISDFYTQLSNPNLSKAESLRRAQINLIKERRYRHAGYWAPFLLIGNWL